MLLLPGELLRILVINLEKAAEVGDIDWASMATLLASPWFLSDSLSSLVSITRDGLRLLKVGEGADFENASTGCFLGEPISFDKVGFLRRSSISLLVTIVVSIC